MAVMVVDRLRCLKIFIHFHPPERWNRCSRSLSHSHRPVAGKNHGDSGSRLGQNPIGQTFQSLGRKDSYYISAYK